MGDDDYVKRTAQQQRYGETLDIIIKAAALWLCAWGGYSAGAWLVRAVWGAS